MNFIKIKDVWNNITLICPQLISKMSLVIYQDKSYVAICIDFIKYFNDINNSLYIPVAVIHPYERIIKDETFEKLNSDAKSEIRSKHYDLEKIEIDKAMKLGNEKLEKLLTVLKKYPLDIEEIDFNI
jgi:hypothetical protein